MTNEQINGFVKDAYTVFVKYRSGRPLTKETQPAAWDDFMEIINKYVQYPKGETEPINGWIMDTAIGLYRELEAENENNQRQQVYGH